MIIAIEAKDLSEHTSNSFAVKLLQQLARYPGLKLIFFIEKGDHKIQAFFPGALFISVGRKTSSRISLSYRYKVKVPGVLKKHNAGLFISFNLDSPATQIPRFFFIDNEYLADKKNRNPGALEKKWKSINKGYTRLIVTAPVFKKEIIVRAGIPGDKIILINPFAALFPQPIKTAEKDLIKSAITGGREFFLCISSFPDAGFFVLILKSFSLFKQRQQSNFKIVLLSESHDEEQKRKLETYKYRDDVIWLYRTGEEAKNELIAAAYGCVLSEYTYDFTAILTGLLSGGVPVICSFDPFGTFEDCFLVSAPDDHRQMAEHMGLIYKDEKFRQEMITKGKEKAGIFSVEKTAEKLWDHIRETVK